MSKKEEILIDEPEIPETKVSNRKKIAIAIAATTLVLAVGATLLVGYLKFDWFNNGNYKIDANINRNIYQANYFSDKKTINAQFTLPDGVNQKKTIIVDTNFVVFVTDKQENKNTAILVILNAQTSEDGKIKDLPHINIFDENEVKELLANPDGAKYPMAVFTFDDEGKIGEIKLPNNMDEYHTETIAEFIQKIIPKLSRNKNEDMSKGLEVKTTKTKNKRTIVQTQAPREFGSFKGSRVSRIVKTEIEDDQVKKVESSSDVYMQSEPEEGQLYFGPKELKYDMKSEITSNEEKYDEKEFADLATRISDKFTLIKYEDLINTIRAKNEEKKEVEETKPLRNLANFAISASRDFPIASFNVLGQTVTIKYSVKVTSSTATNKLVITSGLGTFEFGNKGCSGKISNSKNYNWNIISIPVPYTMGLVTLNCYATGYLSWAFGFESGSGSSTKYYASISGGLKLGASVKAGVDIIASLTAYAEGTVFDASGKVTITKGSVAKGSGFSIKMGKLVAGVKGTALFGLIGGTIYECVLYKGWTVI